MKAKGPPVWVLSWALFPLGLGALILGVVDVAQGYRSLNWTVVSGEILSSSVDKNWLGPDQPKVRYTYRFQNNPYVSAQLWPGTHVVDFPYLTSSQSMRVNRLFPEHAVVSVYVNPKIPNEAALFRGPSRAIKWTSVVFGFVLIGLWAPFTIARWLRT